MMKGLSMKCSFRKASLAILVAAVLVVVPACDSAGQQTSTDSEKTTTSASSGQSTTSASESGGNSEFSLPPNGKYEPAITMTTVGAVAPTLTFRDNETFENNVHTRWALDRFGIEMKYLWTSTTQNNAFVTRMRLALSANEPMPDVVGLTDTTLANDLINTGKFLEVGELWDALGSQNFKEALDADPSMWYPFMREDGPYAIPLGETAMNHDTVLFIRQDWMEKFGFESPKTLADLETIMDAFVNKDPDGNGQKDTIGLSVSLRNKVAPMQATIGWVFGAYGGGSAIPNQWNLLADGTLGYGSIQPEAKDALTTLKDWMSKGYLPKEAGLYDESKAVELFTSGKAGMIAGPFWLDRFPLGDVSKNVEGATFLAHRVPMGPDDKAARQSWPNLMGGVLISKDYEYPEAFILYYNYLIDNFANLNPDSEFKYGFAEGYDYILKPDGTPSYNTAEIPGGRVIASKYTITFEGARIPKVSANAIQEEISMLNYLRAGNTPRNMPETKLASMYNDTNFQVAITDQECADISCKQMFTGAPTPTMQSKMEYLNTMELETLTKIIYGELPVDDFDKFVQDWKSGGGDDITKEVNEWYAVSSGK